MVCITKDLSTRVLNNKILLITWESIDLDIDLSPLSGKYILYAEGTYSQIMNLIKVCVVKIITITGKLNLEQLSTLEEMQNLYINITDVLKPPIKRLNYAIGRITHKSSERSADRLLIVCKRIFINIKNNNILFDLICSYANQIIVLYMYSLLEYTKILLPKLTNLNKIVISSSVDQEIINILGQSSIKHICLLRCLINLDITPIITNPIVESLRISQHCVYDINSKITLLEFHHPDEQSYQDLIKKCNSNKEADFLIKMAYIKTPNEI